MKTNKIIAIYLSPYGKTKEIINKLASAIGGCEVEDINLNSLANRNTARNFAPNELVIVGMPVYADRLPKISAKIFKQIKGNNTPAIAIVSYGNREYGDALLELKNNLAGLGMKVISGAAIIAEHCLNENAGKNRPDQEDDLKIADYANRIKEKVSNIQSIESLENIAVKGNIPYQPLKQLQVPVGDDNCIECGLCEENCPANAIQPSNYRLTNADLCIGCCRCVDVCPTGSRIVRNEEYNNFVKNLAVIAKDRKEIEIFI